MCHKYNSGRRSAKTSQVDGRPELLLAQHVVLACSLKLYFFSCGLIIGKKVLYRKQIARQCVILTALQEIRPFSPVHGACFGNIMRLIQIISRIRSRL